MDSLACFKNIELVGMGPGPTAGMLLADMAAEVICIDRGPITDPMHVKVMGCRGKKSIIVNLKSNGTSTAAPCSARSRPHHIFFTNPNLTTGHVYEQSNLRITGH